jgi:uncharacterized membrane protein YedE/YeeE
MRYMFSALSGLLFGLGLMISDMVNPARVKAFLSVGDIPAGTWDATLMFVMGGAMAVSALAWLLSYRRATSLVGGPLPPPPAERIDARLIGGSAVFGVGWGLVGICPGPALVGLGLGGALTIIFLAAMVAGMVVFAVVNGALKRTDAHA